MRLRPFRGVSGSGSDCVGGGVVVRGITRTRSCSDPAEAEEEVGTALVNAVVVGGSTDRVKPLEGAWICWATVAGVAAMAVFVAVAEVDVEAVDVSV